MSVDEVKDYKLEVFKTLERLDMCLIYDVWNSNPFAHGEGDEGHEEWHVTSAREDEQVVRWKK